MHLSKRDNRVGPARRVLAPIVDRALAHAAPVLWRADKRLRLMVALLPDPHELRVVTTPAVLVDWQLLARAQTRAILETARVGLVPRRLCLLYTSPSPRD